MCAQELRVYALRHLYSRVGAICQHTGIYAVFLEPMKKRTLKEKAIFLLAPQAFLLLLTIVISNKVENDPICINLTV